MDQQGVQRAGADDLKADGIAPGAEVDDDEVLHVRSVDEALGQPGSEVSHEPFGVVQRSAGGQCVVEARHLELGAAQFGSPYLHLMSFAERSGFEFALGKEAAWEEAEKFQPMGGIKPG